MVILVSPDSRGRIDLSPVVRNETYAVEVDASGVITLTPSAAASETDIMAAIRPVLSPEEAFGTKGVKEAADAFYINCTARRRGDGGTRVFDESALHSLIWGDAA